MQIYTFEHGYSGIKGTEYIVLLLMSVAVYEVRGENEGRLFQDKIQACRHITEC